VHKQSHPGRGVIGAGGDLESGLLALSNGIEYQEGRARQGHKLQFPHLAAVVCFARQSAGSGLGRVVDRQRLVGNRINRRSCKSSYRQQPD